MSHNQHPTGHRLSTVEDIKREMQGKVRYLAVPSVPGESVKACVRRVAKRTGLSFGEVWRLWYMKWNRIPADIADRIRKEANAHEAKLDQEFQHFQQQQARFYGLNNFSCDPEYYQIGSAQDDSALAKMV